MKNIVSPGRVVVAGELEGIEQIVAHTGDDSIRFEHTRQDHRRFDLALDGALDIAEGKGKVDGDLDVERADDVTGVDIVEVETAVADGNGDLGGSLLAIEEEVLLSDPGRRTGVEVVEGRLDFGVELRRQRCCGGDDQECCERQLQGQRRAAVSRPGHCCLLSGGMRQRGAEPASSVGEPPGLQPIG